MNEIVEVQQLHFSYDDQAIMQDVSFKAAPGDVIWITGANGSGKSTLLRILAQLLEYSGRILYNGTPVTERRDIIPYVSYIPTEPYLFDYLTGRENAEFLRSLFAIDEAVFQRQFHNLAVRFNLLSALDQTVQQYSLGMRHKLFWSVMLCRQDTTIYLLDEPFSAFDAASQEIGIQLLKQASANGSCVLFASHLDDIGNRLATRKFSISDGCIQEIPNKPDQIRRVVNRE